MWGTHCCEQDIYQIESQEDLDEILEDDDILDGGFLWQYMFADTKEILHDYIVS